MRDRRYIKWTKKSTKMILHSCLYSKDGGIPSHLVGLEDKIKIKHTVTMVKFSRVKINEIKYPVCSALSLLSC